MKKNARFERREAARRLSIILIWTNEVSEKKNYARFERHEVTRRMSMDFWTKWKKTCEGWDSNPWTTYRPDLKSGAVGLAWLPSPNYLITLYLQDIKVRGWHSQKSAGNAFQTFVTQAGAGRRIVRFKNLQILCRLIMYGRNSYSVVVNHSGLWSRRRRFEPA